MENKMEKMSHQERYEDRAKDNSERQSFQLEPRKRALERFIWNKRNSSTGIKGYNVSKFNRKPNKKKRHAGGVAQLTI